MTLLDDGGPADTTTKKHRRTGLIAVLAVLAVALLALGAWLTIDSQREEKQLPEVTDAPRVEQGSAQVADGAQFSGSGSCTIADDVNFTCVYDMADDRVSGTETFTALPGSEENGFGEEPAEYPKEFLLKTDDGTWIGALTGPEMTLFWCPLCGGLHGEWSVEYTGTGAYEGLVYRERAEHSWDDGTVVVRGSIAPVNDD
jgi:hypothetical protein